MVSVQCQKCEDTTPKPALARVCCATCSSEHVELNPGLNSSSGACFACDKENVEIKPLYKCSACRTPGQGMQQCEICSEWSQTDHFVSPGACNHSFCRECWANFLNIQISETNIFFNPQSNFCTVRCMGIGCTAGFAEPHAIKNIVPHVKYSEFKQKGAELLLRLILGGSWCPYPQCGAVCIPPSGETKVTCLNCNRDYCRSCQTAWHDNSCVENRSRLGETLSTINRTTKQCPRCKAHVEKNGGCNHMRCRCRAEWCWLCLTPWPGNCQDNHWFGNA